MVVQQERALHVKEQLRELKVRPPTTRKKYSLQSLLILLNFGFVVVITEILSQQKGVFLESSFDLYAEIVVSPGHSSQLSPGS